MRNTGSQWESLRRGLEALATSVAAEIRAYPRPITACDAQFNHLLELRRLVPLELQRLEAAAADPRHDRRGVHPLLPLRRRDSGIGERRGQTLHRRHRLRSPTADRV